MRANPTEIVRAQWQIERLACAFSSAIEKDKDFLKPHNENKWWRENKMKIGKNINWNLFTVPMM